MKATKTGRVVLLIIAFASLAPPATVAQGTQTAMLMGAVKDTSGAVLRAATVTITSPALIGGSRTATTDEEGGYRFTTLAPGVYEVTASAGGFRSVRHEGVRLLAGATVTLDVRLEVAGLAEVVSVGAPSPMVDVKSSASPTHLDQDLLHNLPTPRSLPNLINLTPGVSGNVSFGGSQESNALFVEGVSMTESEFQLPWTRFNYNWVQEVQVVSLGADAEYGQFTGVAANSVLRSGSNRYSGLGEYWTTRPSWVGRNTDSLERRLQSRFTPRQVLTFWDTSTQLGGPIVRDRMWFFSGFQYFRHDDRPAGFDGPGSRDERDRQFLIKPTAALSPAMRLDGFYEGGSNRVRGDGVGRFTPMEAAADVRQPQNNWNARLTWSGKGATLVEIRTGGFVSHGAEEPIPPNTRSAPAPRFDAATSRSSGNLGFYARFERTDHVVAATVTRYVARWFGKSHELKAGIEHQRNRAMTEDGFPGGMSFTDLAGQPLEVSIWDGERVRGLTRRTGLYAQDRWILHDRLTVNAGIRVDVNRGAVPVKGTIFSTTPISPRAGVAWDLRGDHKTVVRAHYGRYHDALFGSRISFGDTTGTGNPFVIALVVGPNQFQEINRFVFGGNYAIDKDLDHSYVDQLVLGVERELFRDVSVQAQFIRRDFDVFMGLTDTGSIYAPIERADPGPDGRAGTADDGGPITVFNLTNPGQKFRFYTNPSDAFNRYRAFQIVGRKRYAQDWQMQASYTWSRTEGTVGNRWHVNAARFDLGDPGTFVNPNSRINAFGRGPFDPTHEWKLLGTYRVAYWGGVLVSGVHRYHSGLAWGRLVNIVGLRQGRERVRVEPRGTRRLPAIHMLDFRIEKTFAVTGPRRTLGLFFDAFNLGNHGVPNSEAGPATIVQEISGPNFGEPLAWTDPRTLRVGLRFTF